jgi:subtilisin family serine protease
MEVNANDLQVAEDYVVAVESTGVEVISRSRWLNAVSVLADEGQATVIAALPFVRDMRPVARAVKEMPHFEDVGEASGARGGGTRMEYGDSYGQLEQIQVTDLHDDGFDGTGIVIAMLDTGFDIDHEAYRHLDVIATWDFINDDENVANEDGDPEGQDSHGTATLSCVGALKDGIIYGGSYNASFILCKTEIVGDEIQVEEDYWVEGIEWAETLGADLASSSLGYFYWYTYEDMDGNTAVTTIAADMAVARGMVVITSMGNEGGSDWKYMIAPADGDSVLGIGAVDGAGDRVYFSSVGPTYDGRIKPDVMAQGVDVFVATTWDTNSYTDAGGTSFSCPLTSGATGLLLQGHPEWTPVDVIEALRSTATMSSSPDTLMGWGIVQASDAMYSTPLGVDEGEEVAGPVLVWSRGNPVSGGSVFEYQVPVASRVHLAVYDVTGRRVQTLYRGDRLAGEYSARWDGRNARGADVASGIYFCRLTAGKRTAAAKVTLVR